MEFTLYYDGPLATNARPQLKHDIRLVLHPQMRELWTHEPLKNSRSALPQVTREVRGHSFAALVHPRWNFRAELDVLMLRPQTPGGLFAGGGDIDNRLKTLFDAMSVPQQDQVPTNWTPSPDESPIHCLLDDDKWISRVSVKTDRLLAPKNPTHVRLTINVKVQTAWTFGGFAIVG